MAYGRDQVALDAVEQAEARDILKEHRRTQCVAVGITDRQDLGQQGMFLAVGPDCDGLVEFALFVIAQGAIVVSDGQFRFEPDGLGVIRAGLLVAALAVIHRAAVVVGHRVFRLGQNPRH